MYSLISSVSPVIISIDVRPLAYRELETDKFPVSHIHMYPKSHSRGGKFFLVIILYHRIFIFRIILQMGFYPVDMGMKYDMEYYSPEGTF